MIAWNNVTQVDVFIAFKKAEPAFYNTIVANATKYIPGIKCVDGSSSGWLTGSDHASFWNNGYKNALYLGDDLVGKSHPYYHKPTDKVGASVNSKPTAEMFLKAAVANVAVLGEVIDNTAITATPLTDEHNSIAMQVNNERKTLEIRMPAQVKNASVQVITARGQTVFTRFLNQVTSNGIARVDISSLGENTYIVMIQENTAILSRSIVFLHH
jgi:hypothetical protein